MATTTPNLGLIKPERSDNYSVDVMGENMDIIDEKVTSKEMTNALDARIAYLEDNLGKLFIHSISPAESKFEVCTINSTTTAGGGYSNDITICYADGAYVTRLHTSHIHCTLSDEEILSSGQVVGVISVFNSMTGSRDATVVVINQTTGATVANQKITMGGNNSNTVSFIANLSDTYSVAHPGRHYLSLSAYATEKKFYSDDI